MFARLVLGASICFGGGGGGGGLVILIFSGLVLWDYWVQMSESRIPLKLVLWGMRDVAFSSISLMNRLN